MYSKSNKKYSYCQFGARVKPHQPGFFLIEFLYAFFIVTIFIVIIALFIGLSIHWAHITSNRLKALELARNMLEALWLDKHNNLLAKTTTREESFTIEICREKKQLMLGKHVYHHTVTVSWQDLRDHKHTVFLETYL
jgi:hypothetical protein